MTDTQWPRFEVFLQAEADDPHQDVGSVHAPDPELALQNARDVFVRRPNCTSLWIAPAEAIYSRTAQEIREHGLEEDRDQSTQEESYLVFNKPRPAGTQTFAGRVSACSPVQALQLAIESFGGSQAPYAWWILPEKVVVRSSPDDIESMFNPALDKPFRLSTDFHVVSAMRKLRSNEKTGQSAPDERMNPDRPEKETANERS